MASNFKVGDLVWAKMKGFCAWPARIIEPMSEVKRPTSKKNHHFVFFFGSENYAWVQEDTIWNYTDNKAKFTVTNRIPRGYNVAIEAIEDVLKAMPSQVHLKTSDLPSIDEELAQIFPNRSSVSGPHKDYSRDPISSVKKSHDKPRTLTDGTTINKRHSGKKSHSDAHISKKLANSVKKSSMSLGSKGRNAVKSSSTTPVRKSRSHDLKSSHSTTEKKVGVQNPGVNLIRSGTKRSGGVSSHKAKKTKMVVKVGTPMKQDIGKNASPSPPKSVGATEEFKFKMPVIPSPRARPRPRPKPRPEMEVPNDIDNTSPVKSVSSSTQIEETLLRSISPDNTTDSPTTLKIGFLGLGIMGQGMVMNLIRSGHEVTVWNRTSSKCRDFIKEGALKENTPADVVQACDVTISCISDPAAVKDVVFGNFGVLQGITNGKGYIEMSTIDEETIKDVREAIVLRGGRFLEAPVCGSRVPALEGQLVILVSGDRKLYEDCHSCFEAMGKRTFFLGETGMATRMKLVVNMMLGTVMASLAETMALAQKAGLEQEDVAAILAMGPLASTTVSYKSQAIMNNKHDPHFPLQHQQKDLRLALELGDKVEQPLYVAAAVNELYKKARRLGYGESDISAVYRATSA